MLAKWPKLKENPKLRELKQTKARGQCGKMPKLENREMISGGL